MIQPLLVYPDPKIRLISANVRFFNDELNQWITDIRDTMIEHDLDALSAILIGIQYNIIVLKEGESYTPYVNARIIRHAEVATKTERSLYYPGISADIDRYEYISVVYEDARGEPRTREFYGDDARVFQEHLDYSFGSTFVDRCDREMKERINDYLEYGLVEGGGSCPMIFYRDYFKRGARYLMMGILFSFITPFFVSADTRSMIYTADKIALGVVPLLIIGYGIYALYESRRYKQCTSCQTGNILGTSAIMAFQLLFVALGVFLWVAP
jgi:peptide deformylase